MKDPLLSSLMRMLTASLFILIGSNVQLFIDLPAPLQTS